MKSVKIPGVNFVVDDTGLKEGLQPFIKPVYIDAPNTEVVNRAQVLDESNTLKCLDPVERIDAVSISLVPNEYGPNGEPVHELSSKDPRVRFIGAGWRNVSNAWGTRIDNNIGLGTGTFEVSFYGTGLNFLYPTFSGTKDIRTTLDGGIESGNIYYASESSVLGGRKFDTNQILNVAKGLTQGWHTIKFRVASAGVVDAYGFDILNEGTQLTVKPGNAYYGLTAATLLADANLPYKPAALSTGLGARVVNYLDIADSLPKQVFQETGTPGPELISNGTFDTDFSGWTKTGGSVGSISHSATFGGSLNYNDTDATDYLQGNQIITTVIGASYSCSFDIKSHTGGAAILMVASDDVDGIDGNGFPVTQLGSAGNSIATDDVKFTFVAASTTTRIQIYEGNTASNTVQAFLDNISVKASGVAYMVGADHSNEEQIREGGIHWREFGANRADDFSTLVASVRNAAFTLEDNTTSLSGNVSTSGVELSQPSNGGLVFSFVGCGFDMIAVPIAQSSPIELEIFINDVLIDTIDNADLSVADGKAQLFKIVSGLPYGTHRIRFNRTPASGGTLTIKNLIPYQPKKPVVPAGGIVLSDYNYVADFDASTAQGSLLGDNDQIATGVIAKSGLRGIIYTGTWLITQQPTVPTGFVIYTNTIGDEAHCEFSGSGVAIEMIGTGGNFEVRVDGVLHPGATDMVNVADLGSGLYMGSGAVTKPWRLNITGLPVASHKLTITQTDTNAIDIVAIGVITPIHVNSLSFNNGGYDSDLRNFTPIKESEEIKSSVGEAKGLLNYDHITNEIMASHNVSGVIDRGVGQMTVYHARPFKDNKYHVVTGGSSQHVRLDGNANQGIHPHKAAFQIFNDAEALLDTWHVSIAFFGELAEGEK